MTAALIIVAWWAVLIFAWALFRASARADRRIARMEFPPTPGPGPLRSGPGTSKDTAPKENQHSV